MSLHLEITAQTIRLPLNIPQGSVRIADGAGNHENKPTQTKNEDSKYIEWMITNSNIEEITKAFALDLPSIIQTMKDITTFTNDSEYSKRTTTRLAQEILATFEGFDIIKYFDEFSSFEKTLASGIKVRITFKLGDFGLEPHPHMYVLIPFNHALVKIINKNGNVNKNESLGTDCSAEWQPTKDDLGEIIVTLAHASKEHRDDLVKLLS